MQLEGFAEGSDPKFASQHLVEGLTKFGLAWLGLARLPALEIIQASSKSSR